MYTKKWIASTGLRHRAGKHVILVYMDAVGQGARSHEEMRDVLKNPEAEGPKEHYYMLRGGKERGNVTVWVPGKVGDEFIKTFGHYHTSDFPERYQILAGEGIALMQKRRMVDGAPADDQIEAFKVLHLKAGDILDIPIGFGHMLANTGNQFLVSLDNSPSDPETEKVRPHADYEPIRRMHGFAYYVVEHEGAPTLVKNPTYSEVGSTDFAGVSVIQ